MSKTTNKIKELQLYIEKKGIRNTIKKIPKKIFYTFDNIYYRFQNKYERWIKINEPTKRELNLQKNVVFETQPKFTLIIVMTNNQNNLIETFRSLNVQTYSNFEVCIIDTTINGNLELEDYINLKDRIKYQKLTNNVKKSGAINCGIKMASGDYIAILNENAVLPSFSLYEIAKCINENPNAEFIYTDEDKIEKNGKRIDPIFKGNFAIDTLRSENYIKNLKIVKKDLVERLKGFDETYDNFAEYDFLLRIAENVDDNKIIHISKILYHTYVNNVNTSTLNSRNINEGIAILENHLKRSGLEGSVGKGIAEDTFNIKYRIKENSKVSILIPNKDNVQTLNKCIDSILNKTTYDNYEIVIIENNSQETETEEYYEKLKNNPNIKILKYETSEFNYSKLINYGVKNATGEFIVQLNNDIEIITNQWIELMLGFAQRKDVGAVGIKLLYPDNTVQHAGVLLGLGGIAGHYFKNLKDEDYGYCNRAVIIQNITAITGACMMINKKIYEQVGGMNEKLAVAFNDIDLCLKVKRAGYLNIYNSDIKAYHYESKTRGEENTKEKISRFDNEINLFKQTWKDELEKGDWYYNRNLSLLNNKFEIKTLKIER